MNITCNNIHAHELIGLETKIIDSSDNNLIDKRGRIVYETKNMLWLERKDAIKKIPKSIVRLEVIIDNVRCIIEGKRIIGRPEDRIRRL